MPSVNVVILAGFLTRDVETRYTPKGTAVANFSVAVNRKWRGDDGQQNEEVSFFECVAWGKTAETIAQYFKKGGAILVQGRLKQESWDDRESGKKRYAVKVIVESFNFVGDSKGSGGDPGTGGGYRQPQPATRLAPQTESAEPEDNVPFTSILKAVWRGLTRYAQTVF